MEWLLNKNTKFKVCIHFRNPQPLTIGFRNRFNEGFLLDFFCSGFKYCWFLIFAYLLFISWCICSGRCCMDKLRAFHANQTSELRVRLAPWNRVKPSSKIILQSITRRCFRFCSLLPCGHRLGKGWPLVSFMMPNFDFVIFPCGILGQVWYLIVLIPDLCRLSYFEFNAVRSKVFLILSLVH